MRSECCFLLPSTDKWNNWIFTWNLYLTYSWSVVVIVGNHRRCALAVFDSEGVGVPRLLATDPLRIVDRARAWCLVRSWIWLHAQREGRGSRFVSIDDGRSSCRRRLPPFDLIESSIAVNKRTIFNISFRLHWMALHAYIHREPSCALRLRIVLSSTGPLFPWYSLDLSFYCEKWSVICATGGVSSRARNWEWN